MHVITINYLKILRNAKTMLFIFLKLRKMSKVHPLDQLILHRYLFGAFL